MWNEKGKAVSFKPQAASNTKYRKQKPTSDIGPREAVFHYHISTLAKPCLFR
jgi:hypothetical protein